jgi:hypothetical protein
MRGQSYGTATLGIDKRRRSFAIILDAHSAPPHPTVRRHGNAIGKTAISLDDGEQPFVLLRQRKVEQFSRPTPHLYAKDLARAEMTVKCSRRV